MIRNILYAIIFAAITLLLAAQVTPEGHALSQDYHGLVIAQIACGFMFFWNIGGFFIRVMTGDK